MIKNGDFIDSLLDNWKNKDGIPAVDAKTFADAAVADAEQIKTDLKKLYLVFHYPQYDTTTGPTNFNGLTPNEKDRVFNYVYSQDYTDALTGGGNNTKVLLSTKGITKANMVTLKMLLDSIVAAADLAAIQEILIKEATDKITDPFTLGGNNTLISKTGGKGKNKSSKRVKKHPRRRNKSSKSLI